MSDEADHLLLPDLEESGQSHLVELPPAQFLPYSAPRAVESDNEVEILLRNLLVGFEVEDDLAETELKKLSTHHPFSWQSVMSDPKGDHGVVAVRGSWYKTMEYTILHTGGFVRLCTLRGRAYWNAQNEQGHTTPDWKLHFSCEVDDIPMAWDIIAALFMDMKCEVGMKATYLSKSDWSPGQRGREITVYLFGYHYSFQGYMQGVDPPNDHVFHLGTEHTGIYTAPFWYTFVTEAESRLRGAGVRSRGVAAGDLALPGCHYASLRNEAFVMVTAPVTGLGHAPPYTRSTAEGTGAGAGAGVGAGAGAGAGAGEEVGEKAEERDSRCSGGGVVPLPLERSLQYPPNHMGWNAAKHPNPYLDLLFILNTNADLRCRLYNLEERK